MRSELAVGIKAPLLFELVVVVVCERITLESAHCFAGSGRVVIVHHDAVGLKLGLAEAVLHLLHLQTTLGVELIGIVAHLVERLTAPHAGVAFLVIDGLRGALLVTVVGKNIAEKSVTAVCKLVGFIEQCSRTTALRACTDGEHRQQKSRKMLHANVYLGLYLCRLSFFE